MTGALIVCPDDKMVLSCKRPDAKRAINALLGSVAVRVHTFPNGDILYAAREPATDCAFRIGKSAPIRGRAVIIGRPANFGFYTSTNYSVETVSNLVEFVGDNNC